MKGLGNYVCRRRLSERERQASLVADPELDRIARLGRRIDRRAATAPS